MSEPRTRNTGTVRVAKLAASLLAFAMGIMYGAACTGETTVRVHCRSSSGGGFDGDLQRSQVSETPAGWVVRTRTQILYFDWCEVRP